MRKRTSATEAARPRSAGATVRFVVVTLDAHLASAVADARQRLRRTMPQVDLRIHIAADFAASPAHLERCRADIADADVLLVTQLFLEEHVSAVLPALTARRDDCAAIISAICAPALMRLTRLGRFRMNASEAPGPWSPLAVLRRLISGRRGETKSAGERQMQALRRIPQLLRYVPGTAQDVRAYFLVLQYWLAGSPENLANLVRFVVGRYVPNVAEGRARNVPEPRSYPEVGLYHPRLGGDRIVDDVAQLPGWKDGETPRGVVGLLLMRSYLLAGNTAHYDAVIEALERRGLRVVPGFASGLDGRPVIDHYFTSGAGRPDVLLSLTGFSLVGGPAYNDARGARTALASLDVPYLALQTLEFQSIDEWRSDPRGLSPLQATLQVALPELDGATGPLVYGGKSQDGAEAKSLPIAERVEALAARVARLVALRRTPRHERRIAIAIFNFPPNAGAVGTAAYLDVFASLHRTLNALAAAGYRVEVPPSVQALRDALLEGNTSTYGMAANVAAVVAADDHVRRERYLTEIERQWGPAPGRQLSNGRSLFVLGREFGNVFVGVQPSFGYEGDPMRLLFERGFAPTHAFSNFYRWLREDFGAHAVLHFGTHGALEFMPGKQVGLTDTCWPDRLIGDLPNFYLYAANNPSEGTLAKRRAAATLVTYQTPPLTNAGLYRGLLDLRAQIDRWQSLTASRASATELRALLDAITTQAAALELSVSGPSSEDDCVAWIGGLRAQLAEIERALIPYGMHVVGDVLTADARAETLASLAQAGTPAAAVPPVELEPARIAARRLVDAEQSRLTRTAACAAAARELVESGLETAAADRLVAHLSHVNELLREDHELPAIVHALDGRFVAPTPGGDLLRNPDVLPTGRNMYGFDPYHLPSSAALAEGRRQAELLLQRHVRDTGALPKSVAMVLWGTDNMKSDGVTVALVLALLGAVPRFDTLGRLCGAALVPLDELTRPRIDVVVSLSGVFRDLFPLQVRLLADAARLAATVDEPPARNHVRANALAHRQALGCSAEEAALRVFGNAEGAYGANVNLLVEEGSWRDADDLADAFVRRKSFSYGAGDVVPRPALFERALGGADLTYQALDAIESGVTDLDQYVDALGALSQAARRARGATLPAYVGDFAVGSGRVRTVDEQVVLETRTRMLNPRWYEAMLASGYEGARQIAAHVTTTLGWSATAGAVAPWVYREIGATYVLDAEMRRRLASLNPHAAVQVSGRLLEAHDRGFWQADAATLDALREAHADLEDALEGVHASP